MACLMTLGPCEAFADVLSTCHACALQYALHDKVQSALHAGVDEDGPSADWDQQNG